MLGVPKFRAVLESALAWIYPEKCRECEVSILSEPVRQDGVLPVNRFFCSDCWGKIEAIGAICCPVCALPFQSPAALSHSSSHVCGDCRTEPPYFSRAVTPYRYEGPLAKAIQLFKYNEQVALASPLADLLIGKLSDSTVDLVTAIPLHPVKLRSRSFNQSLMLAKKVARHFAWPFQVDVIRRTRETLPQVGLSKKARQKNIRGAFSVWDKEIISGKRILLIDDVYTTGATFREAAKVLRKSGAAEVIVAAPVRMVLE